MKQYQITSKTDLPLWLDTTGLGNKTENLKNIVALPAKEQIVVTLAEQRASELQGEWNTKITVKPYNPPKPRVW